MTKPARPSKASAVSRTSAAEIARVTAIVLAVVAATALLWYARTAILLLFGGILLAVLLDGLSQPLMRWTGMAKGPALTIVISAIAALIAALAWSAGPVLVEQLTQLGVDLTQAITKFGRQAANQAGQDDLLRNFDWSELIALVPSPLGIATGATAVATSMIGALTAILIVIFFGVYLALNPDFYLRLVLKAAPRDKREELREVLMEIGAVLHRWLNGQFLAMAIVGGITYIGLLLLGIPLAFALALCSDCSSSFPISGRSLAPRRCCLSRPVRLSTCCSGIRPLPVRAVAGELCAHALDPIAGSVASACCSHRQSDRVRRYIRRYRPCSRDTYCRGCFCSHTPLSGR